MIQLVSRSLVDTARIAHGLADVVRDGDFITLCGDMGAGKTAFTKDFAAALGVEERVTSPTFVFVQTYQGRMPVHHADLYRIERVHEVEDLGLIELVEGGGVGIIEWGEAAETLLDQDYLRIDIAPGDEDDDNVRKFTFNAFGKAWLERESQLDQAIQRSM